jgi:transcriptional regulator with XRE-family HTH domain
MTQQVFADRIGRSKSWVDKVERGVRTLDRLSVIETVAAALGVAPGVLVGRTVRRAPATDVTADLDRVREALARYDVTGEPGRDWPASVDTLDRQVGYAWAAYRHAHHVRVLRMLPGLLAAARHATRGGSAVAGAGPAAWLLVNVYRLAAHVLVKLDEGHLAWLAADRATAIAAGEPRYAALAAVPLAQALRALRQGRSAVAAANNAVDRLNFAPSATSRYDHPLAGVLLGEAALAAATCGDATAARGAIGHAARIAAIYGEQIDGDIASGPTVVDLARAVTAAKLGDGRWAIAVHCRATSTDTWYRLPAEHRAAHLIDIARAHLDGGDPLAAGRTLVTADRIAPGEVRLRPAGHTALAAVLHAGDTTADVTRLAAAVGLTRR